MNEPASAPGSVHESDWETTSEDEFTMDLPVQKADISKLTQVPLTQLARSKCVSWLSDVITFRHANKNFERIMVTTIHKL